jgi:hypothetical protein
MKLITERIVAPLVKGIEKVITPSQRTSSSVIRSVRIKGYTTFGAVASATTPYTVVGFGSVYPLVQLIPHDGVYVQTDILVSMDNELTAFGPEPGLVGVSFVDSVGIGTGPTSMLIALDVTYTVY